MEKCLKATHGRQDGVGGHVSVLGRSLAQARIKSVGVPLAFSRGRIVLSWRMRHPRLHRERSRLGLPSSAWPLAKNVRRSQFYRTCTTRMLLPANQDRLIPAKGAKVSLNRASSLFRFTAGHAAAEKSRHLYERFLLHS